LVGALSHLSRRDGPWTRGQASIFWKVHTTRDVRHRRRRPGRGRLAVTQFGRCLSRGADLPFRTVDDVERLLCRLAVNDEASVGMVLSSRAEVVSTAVLRPKVDLPVRLGALFAVGYDIEANEDE